MIRWVYCRVWLLVVCMALLGTARQAQAVEQRFRAKLGCVPLVASNIEAMAFTEYLSTLLLNELERGGTFEVAERKRLEAAMDMEGIRSDGLGQEPLQRLGGRLGLDYLVSGTVSSQAGGLQLELQVLNLKAQRVAVKERLRLREADAPRVLQELSVRIAAASQEAPAQTTETALVRPLAPVQSLDAVGTTSSIRLSWRHPEPERIVGYMVMRAAAEHGPFNSVSTVTEPAYSDESLRLNETYFYRVVAVGQGGVSSEPSPVVRGATSVAPAAPIFMNLEPILGGAVLTWRQRPYSGGDERMLPKGVRIYRRLAADKEFIPVGRSGDEQPVFRDQGLVDGATYLYVMTAFNQAGAESERSVQLSVTLPAVTAGLTAVSDKVRRIPLSWQPHPFSGTTGYRLQRAEAKEGPYQELATISDRNQTSYLDQSLKDKTTYWYRILAVSKEQGSGGPSAPASATTRDLPPAPVKVVAGQGEPRRVTLTWETAATVDDELSGFSVYRGEPGQEKLIKIAELPADKRSYRDDREPLKDATTYSYVVAAHNTGGAISPLSARANATTKPVPTTPQGVSASTGEPRRVTLRWQKNPEKDIAEYLVFRQLPDGDLKQLAKTAETQFVDAELRDGVTYQYRVQAVDQDRLQSPASAVAAGSTKPLPKPVEGLVLKDKATRLISWQKSAQVDVKRYHVYKKGFLGGQRLATVEGAEWKVAEPGKLELYLTAEDADGLESEPSAVLVLE